MTNADLGKEMYIARIHLGALASEEGCSRQISYMAAPSQQLAILHKATISTSHMVPAII